MKTAAYRARPINNKPLADAVYATPAGKLCKLVKIGSDADGAPEAELAYVGHGEHIPHPGGFTLSQRAWHLLSRVG